MSNRIVVVGGGFAGFWAAVAARRVASAQIDILVVSRQPVLQMRPRLYEAEPERLQVDLLPLLRKVDVEFASGEATSLDDASRTLVVDQQKELRYGRLVVATGSALRRPPLPGADHAYSIDTVHEAIAFDRRLAEIAGNGRPPTVVVIGAGFTGIELALELRDRLAHYGARAREHAEHARIVLVDRANVVGSELGVGPRAVIEAALTDARVELHLGTAVAALTRNRLLLAGGQMKAADAIVLTTGMIAAGFARKLPGEHDELGRIVVDQTLRAPSACGVFVGGDAAAVDDGDGHVVLQSCQHALQLGRFAGEKRSTRPHRTADHPLQTAPLRHVP